MWAGGILINDDSEQTDTRDPGRQDSGDAHGPLTRLTDGRSVSTEELVPILYDDLRRVANSFFQREKASQTLQPTALVHEAFIRLVDQRVESWESQSQFIAIAARSMRRVLVDAARSRGRAKRGGNLRRVTLLEDTAGRETRDVDILDLEAALQDLEKVSERFVQIVELRYFGGLTLPEVARLLGVSRTIIVRDWAQARAWLATQLNED